jgi:hypothetical protein
MHTGFVWKTLKEEYHLEHLGKWQSDVKMDIKAISWKNVNWIYLAHDRKNWRSVVNTGIDHVVPHKSEYLLATSETASSP